MTEEKRTPHTFVSSDPILPDEHGDWEAQIDVTEWCKVCGWHQSNEIHAIVNENGTLPPAGKNA